MKAKAIWFPVQFEMMIIDHKCGSIGNYAVIILQNSSFTKKSIAIQCIVIRK